MDVCFYTVSVDTVEMMELNPRTKRYEMHFTESEMKTLAWLCKSEIAVQEQLLEYSDGTLLAELQELYESFTW